MQVTVIPTQGPLREYVCAPPALSALFTVQTLLSHIPAQCSHIRAISTCHAKEALRALVEPQYRVYEKKRYTVWSVFVSVYPLPPRKQ